MQLLHNHIFEQVKVNSLLCCSGVLKEEVLDRNEIYSSQDRWNGNYTKAHKFVPIKSKVSEKHKLKTV